LAYATTAQLGTWIGVASPADAARLLDRASTVIDYALIGAIYNVDGTGSPTDANVIQAVQDATCAQVEWWLANNDELEQYERWHSISSVDQGVSIQRLPGKMPKLAPRAQMILQLVVPSILPSRATV
jgi:hypothetical protein